MYYTVITEKGGKVLTTDKLSARNTRNYINQLSLSHKLATYQIGNKILIKLKGE